jgi:hypothetical protein
MVDGDIAEPAVDPLLSARGNNAAKLIWDDVPDANSIIDPQTPAFADAVIDSLSRSLATAPGALQRLMRSATKAAEDLNVEPFQGLVEIIQNADDLGAKEVRFAIRASNGGYQLLLVHDGEPVVCQHVLAMTLPYLTTKKDDSAQKGRFGIGLKTLARISIRLSVHSHPYHSAAGRRSPPRTSPPLSWADETISCYISTNIHRS